MIPELPDLPGLDEPLPPAVDQVEDAAPRPSLAELRRRALSLDSGGGCPHCGCVDRRKLHGQLICRHCRSPIV